MISCEMSTILSSPQNTEVQNCLITVNISVMLFEIFSRDTADTILLVFKVNILIRRAEKGIGEGNIMHSP